MLAGIVLLITAGCAKKEEKPGSPGPMSRTDSTTTITISPTMPSDIAGGAGQASLMAAAVFAWQEFIALNWPAVAQTGMPNTRDVANANASFGDPSFTGPLVWHTFRAKVEIFPGTGVPHGYNGNNLDPTLGYDSLPEYIYQAPIPSCNSAAVGPAGWINLDETSQIGLDNMYAGILPSDSTEANSRPNLIRFMAKANRTEYNYVVRNHYWDHGGNYIQAVLNLKHAIVVDSVPAQPYINFDTGTVEIKAAWRPLAASEDPTRFYTTKVRYYEPQGSGLCYREAIWGLVALHIIQKTPSAPSFIFATFEQADNILTTDGTPLEDSNGIAKPIGGASTQPGLTYHDSLTDPRVSIIGDSYCGSGGAKLFYVNNSADTGLPTNGSICVNRRDNATPPAIIQVNKSAHSAIAAYSREKGIANSPWMYYKLVNVQAQPFDKTNIDSTDPNSTHNPATFYQANIVVETNYTLQMFNGRIANNGAPTDYNNDQNHTPGFKNVHIFPKSGGQVTSYNMGGCMGCHGNAQVKGNDFSFILSSGRTPRPDPLPGRPEATWELRRKYLSLFGLE